MATTGSRIRARWRAAFEPSNTVFSSNTVPEPRRPAAVRPSRRLSLEGPPVPVPVPLRRHALGHPPSVAALRDRLSCRPGTGAARVHDPRGAQRELRARHARTGDERSRCSTTAAGGDLEPPSCSAAVAACPGHPEMEGRPSSSNSTPALRPWHPPAAGEAVALKLAGPGRLRSSWWRARAADPRREPATRNSAWGLGLDDLVFLVDWTTTDRRRRIHESCTARRPTGSSLRLGNGTEHGSDGPGDARRARAARGNPIASVDGLV